MRKISEIIVHATATRPKWWDGKPSQQKVDEVRRWHVDGNGWADIGYHFLIDRDGTVVTGRPLGRAGAHVKGRNTGSVGISLFGGFGGSASDVFSDSFTPEQDLALRRLIADLELQFGKLKLSGHNEYANKACPCFQVSRWLQRQAPKTKVQSKTLAASTLTAVAGSAGTYISVISDMAPMAQYMLIGVFGVIAIAALVVFRERLKKAF